MQYVKAFNVLGFDVPSPRKDWSAEKDDGICITLWKSEVEWTPPPPRFDLWGIATPGEADWEALAGHKKRTGHLARAVLEFDGWVDAYENADPWIPAQRVNHRWRITKFDEATGYFSAIAKKLK